MNYAIILAAGQGQRMSTKKDKMLLPVCGKPLIYYSLMAFNDHSEIDSIVVVCSRFNKDEIEKTISQFHFKRIKKVVVGGKNRQTSLEKGLKYIEKSAKKDDIVLVHNGANPLPSQEEITYSIERAKESGACIVGHFATSTVKEVDGERIVKTHDREKIFTAETPQVAKFELLKKAVENAKKKKLEVTDEAMMLEAINQKVVFTEGHEHNFKVTTQADYARLRAVLGDVPEDFRVGIGQDSHMFEEEKKGLVLGGVKFPEELKLKANSDGDVVLHAVFNSLSQAIGDMSLGFYADKECKEGVKDSSKYLQIILEKIKKEKFEVNSLGIMIEGARPQIDPIVPEMKRTIAKILEIPTRRVGVTATTGEKCTVFGEGLGIQCFVIASLVKNK